MDFSSSGSVTTQDGRVINFNLSFSVSREFVSNTQVRIQAGDALLDPLVINLRNASASLGDRNYSFDIDMDGKPDNIALQPKAVVSLHGTGMVMVLSMTEASCLDPARATVSKSCLCMIRMATTGSMKAIPSMRSCAYGPWTRKETNSS